MRRNITGIVCIVLAAFCLSGGSAGSASAGEVLLKDGFKADSSALKLVKTLANFLQPESLEVILDGDPTADGVISHVYIEAKGIRAGTPYRLDKVTIEGKLVRLTPVSKWNVDDIKSLQPQKWEGFFNAEATILENDLRAGVKTFMAKKKDRAKKWSGISVDFRPGQVFVKGKYDINSGMNAAFKISSGLEIRGGKQIWLVNTNVEINNDDQNDAIREELKKINPPVDFSKEDVPLTLRAVTITDKSISVRTTSAPQPFEGTAYRFTK